MLPVFRVNRPAGAFEFTGDDITFVFIWELADVLNCLPSLLKLMSTVFSKYFFVVYIMHLLYNYVYYILCKNWLLLDG